MPKSKLNVSGKNLIFFAFIVALVSISAWSYFNLDQRVFSLLSQKPPKWHRNHWLAEFILLGKAWLPIWLLLIWSLATGRTRPVLIGLLALIMVAVTVSPLKVGTARARPYEVLKARSGEEGQPNLSRHQSFPSGDTAVVFAVATVMMPFVTWPSACLLLAACAGIALLRVTGMAHYPSDVFAGAAIGSLAGWLAKQIGLRWSLFERLQTYLSRKMIIIGIIIIPVSYGLSEGADELQVFLETYGLLILSIFILVRALRRLRSISAATEGADFSRFDLMLRYLRRRRTLALGIAFVAVIAENIIDGRKPHELAFDDGSVVAFVGLVLVIAGTSIRFWARGHFVKGHLFTTGPYGIIRHPLYLGSLLIVVGVLFQLSGWLNWLVILIAFAVFNGAAIMYEERSLERVFGKQWQLYKAKTPAMIPSLRVWLLPKEISRWSSKVYLNTGELSRSLMFLCLPLLIELTEDLVFEGMLGL